MGPSVILTGILAFITALFLHVIVWRSFRPGSYMVPLLVVFFIVPPVCIILGVYTGLFPVTGPLEGATTLLLYLSLASAYVMTFPALQAKSPTLAIVLALARAGTGGLSLDELRKKFGRHEVRDFLLEDLVRTGLLKSSDGWYTVTLKGRLLALFFLSFRSLLGLPPGRG